jgi:methoxymalonate biosynthesis acyl carrier protein
MPKGNPPELRMTTKTEAKEVVRNFILGSISVEHLRDDDDLFESGLVNSLFAVQLMTFIEKIFAIEVGADDLDIKNFQSIDAATEFVLRRNGRV